MLYDLIPTMPDHRLAPPIEKFGEAVSNARLLAPHSAISK